MLRECYSQLPRGALLEQLVPQTILLTLEETQLEMMLEEGL